MVAWICLGHLLFLTYISCFGDRFSSFRRETNKHNCFGLIASTGQGCHSGRLRMCSAKAQTANIKMKETVAKGKASDIGISAAKPLVIELFVRALASAKR